MSRRSGSNGRNSGTADKRKDEKYGRACRHCHWRGTASGKTTFAEALEARLSKVRLRVFHMDNYFKAPEDRPKITGFVNGKEYLDDNHPDTMDLAQFHKDFDAARAEAEIIIVEGILALWDEEIRLSLDLKLFVDCDADERIIRRIKRNLNWGQDYGEITDRYLNAVRPRHDQYVEPCKWRADLILNGSFPSETALEMVAAYLLARLEGGR